MLSPETLVFQTSIPTEKKGTLLNPAQCVKTTYYRCHENDCHETALATKLSIVFPKLKSVPLELENVLGRDTESYILNSFDNLGDAIFSKEFLKLFVMSGELFISMDSRKNDPQIDTFFTILPNGKLVLWLDTTTFSSLTIEGVSPHFRGKNRVVLEFNLKDILNEANGSTNKLILKWRNSFNSLDISSKTDIIINWIPPKSSSICPSTIAKYFSQFGEVSVFSPEISVDVNTLDDSMIPDLADESEIDFDAVENWIGALLLRSSTQLLQEFASQCSLARSNTEVNETKDCIVHVIEAEGIYLPKTISNIFDVLSKIAGRSVPWVIMCAKPSAASLHQLQSNMNVKVYQSASRMFVLSSEGIMTRSKLK